MWRGGGGGYKPKCATVLSNFLEGNGFRKVITGEIQTGLRFFSLKEYALLAKAHHKAMIMLFIWAKPLYDLMKVRYLTTERQEWPCL